MTNNIPPTNEVFDQFRDAMVGRGIIPPDSIIADGEIHRCGTEGKPNGDDGAYKLYLDGLPAGGIENHRDGLGWRKWNATIANKMAPAEQAAHQERIKAAQAKRQAERDAKEARAREEACLIWAEAIQAGSHPYLTRKGVSAHGALLHKDGRLVLPLRDASGALQSLQFIDKDGAKRFLPGGKKRGCYCSIGKPDGVLCIVEGFATGASIHEATGYAVVVAFDAGNLKPVAQALRAKLPDDTRIVVCADDDWAREDGNIGRNSAEEAAQAVGGVVAVPVFDEEVRAKDDTDFNDMMALRGADAVKAVIDAALAGQAAGEESNAPAQATPAKARKPRKPHRFVVDDGGVFFVEDGNSTWIVSPLHVVAKTRDTKSNSWGRLLRWKDGDGVPHEWAMPIELLHGDGAEVWQELMRQGLAIASGRRPRNLLSSYLQTCPVEARARCVDRLGWHGASYVTPDGQIGGDEHVVFQNAQHIELAFSVSGTVDEWRGSVATMAEGNSRLVFSISLAFAGALAHLAGNSQRLGGFGASPQRRGANS
jgi:putative DNA primase/helicase